jgi:hypothetical protein
MVIPIESKVSVTGGMDASGKAWIWTPLDLGLNSINLKTTGTTTGAVVQVAGCLAYQIAVAIDISAPSSTGRINFGVELLAPDGETAVYGLPLILAATGASAKTTGGIAISIGENYFKSSAGTLLPAVVKEHFAPAHSMRLSVIVSQAIDADKIGTANVWLTGRR